MKRICVLLFLFFTTTTFLHSQLFELELYLLREGIESATAKANETLSNPVLVNAITANIVYTVPGTELEYQGVLSYEGADIGKANFWIYFFSEKNNPNQTAIILTAKASIMGNPAMFVSYNAEDFANFSNGEEEVIPILSILSYSHPIDLDNIIDSDKFVKAIVENADYGAIQEKLDGNDQHISIVGIVSAKSDYLSLEGEQTYWARMIFDAASSDTICCATPFNDLSQLYCAEFSEQEPPQELEFFLMKEGLEVAKAAAHLTLSNPILVSISSLYTDFLGMQLEMIFEGADIGKANNWTFVFKEEDDESNVVGFTTSKILGMIWPIPNEEPVLTIESFANPIDETQLVDSDEFVKALVNKPEFKRPSGDTLAAIGVFSTQVDMYCFSSIENHWHYLLLTGDEIEEANVLVCCSAPYFDVSELTCED